MSNLVTYFVENMRATFPSGKVAERNPDRFVTVNGTFYRSVEGKNGALSRGEQLSYSSKSIDNETALSEGFAIDLAAGTLTVPEGERGRKPVASVSQDAIAARLAALANPDSDEDEGGETPTA